ncbi:hypothetical protein TrLO_g13113 [Triparma laevis f. longispina]|nr:hypothetical protein TrLO_g13113 [Triparma laevis f. longispina]
MGVEGIEKFEVYKCLKSWVEREVGGDEKGEKKWGGGVKWQRRKERLNGGSSSSSSSSISGDGRNAVRDSGNKNAQSKSPTDSISSLKIPILISLSGGVDSMVITHCLHQLSSKYPIKIYACHLNYGNRSEANAEANWVSEWCTERDIECYIEDVSIVGKRGEVDRNQYEKLTRSIRYSMYLNLISTFKARGVVFGHHSGDVVENVITNGFKGKSVLGLSGMKGEGWVNGVMVLRPLLSLEKEKVLKYAEKFGVGYFKDTTPSWSTRGRLRNEVMPILEEVFGVGYERNLVKLGGGSDEVNEVVQKLIVEPFKAEAIITKGGGWFDGRLGKGRGSFWWETCLLSFLHGLQIGMLSSKSAAVLINHVELDALESRWLQLRPDCGTFLREDGRFFAFRKGPFKWGKEGAKWREEAREGFRTFVGSTNRLGDWIVKSSVILDEVKEGDEETARELVRSPPWASLEDLLAKGFEYSILVRTKKKAMVRGLPGSPSSPKGGHDALSPPRRSTAVENARIRSLSESPMAFPTLTLLPTVEEKTANGRKPIGFKGIGVKLINALPLLDCEKRVELEEEGWAREKGYNISVVKVSVEYVGGGDLLEDELM